MDLLHTLLSQVGVKDVADAALRLKRVHVRGSHGSSTSFLAAGVAALSKRPVLLVVAHLDDADEAVDELTSAGVDALRFPALEVLPGETSVSLELFAERVGVVRRMMQASDGAHGSPPLLVAPVQALMQPVPGASSLGALLTSVRVGQTLEPAQLIRWLDAAGYDRVDAIEEPGDFASRGGIIDIFPPAPLSPQSQDAARSSASPGLLGAAIPVRVDFFGDQVDRITEIDLDTMGSDRAIQSVELVCASLEKVFAGASTPALAAPQRSRAENNADIEAVPVAHIDATGGPGACPMLEYLSKDTLVLLHEPLEVVEQARGYFERLTDPRIYGPPAILKQLQERFASFIEIAQFSGGKLGHETEIELPIEQLPELGREAEEAVKELAAIAAGAHGPRVCVMCQNPGELSRFAELIDQHAPDAKPRIHAELGYVHRGFIWQGSPSSLSRSVAPSLLLIPYHELLHRFESRRRSGSRGKAGQPGDARIKAARAMDTFLDFGSGDYVVHREHGIALFSGLVTMQPRQVKREGPVVLPSDRPNRKERKAKTRLGESGHPHGEDPDEGLEEYLTLEFAGKSILYIPTSKIDQVQKYVGGFRGKPTLSALGGTRWKKQKEQVSESVKDLASEMMRIRAARASMPGVRYPADTTWQREFEAEFPYTETEDQLAALSEIKKDMTREQPMDRLLCGDVGYGKTEVAIRAAFKAVEFGKQVAVLVPTTVLAEQHERTFKSRFADYPFRVESISRFKTTKEVNDVLAAVRKGEVDIVIGTHRLLSKDVKFNDLGVVVIDEEQRFGVEHKERLLSLRLTVDVLTLSATPIPRTLHLSMLGLRDISSLTTAPVDRRAVVTEVIPYNQQRIKQAIQRELARDGQIFFVHNRVYDILSVADNVQKLAPDARIVIGHGQMPDGELEEVMLKFMRRQADILVSTTIIESGIDIPTANTMFIDGADRFGLAELHQLRGRVGRYKHRAYCYMLLPENRTVTEKAVKRLKAIEEFSMLGAGFKIAMRDLEIRGAGNILGPEQSGHIAAVGYEMYCQLLDRAVKELKNEPTNVSSETSVEIGVSGMIPKRYIPSDMRRMEAYRRVAVAQTQEELDRIETEIKQAYGATLPLSTQRLLEVASLRVAASHLQIRSISIRGADVLIRAKPDDAARVGLLLRAQPPRINEPRAEASATSVVKGLLTKDTASPRQSSSRVTGTPTPSLAPARGSSMMIEAAVTVLPPPSGESLAEVYFRPPANYFEPITLLRVLKSRMMTAPIASPVRPS